MNGIPAIVVTAVGICDDILRSQLAQVAMTSHLNKRTCIGFVQNVIELSERRMHYYMWISVVELLLIVANVTRNCEYRTFQTIWIVKERSKRLLLHYTILKLYSLLYRFYCVEISKCRSWYFIDRMAFENKDEELKPVFDQLCKLDTVPTKEAGFVKNISEFCHISTETAKKLFDEMQQWKRKQILACRNYRHDRVRFVSCFHY